MKAIVQRTYGSPNLLELTEIATPTIEDDEVLVEVYAASIHPDVWHVVRGVPYVLRLMGAGLRKPKNPVPGTDVAGRVTAVGENVTQFTPGDAVFGETISGTQWTNGGAYAEYVASPAKGLTHKPDNITFEQAAAVPTSGLIALQEMHSQDHVQSGETVLINGAGGGVGTFTVQLAKAYGANVTGVDHTEKLDMIRSIGADQVIDYTREDFTQGSERYDRIIDIPGNHSFSECRRALTPEGKYVLIGHDQYRAVGHRYFGSLPQFFKLMAISVFVTQLSEMGFSTPPKSDSMAQLRELLADGAITPIIDRTYPLSEVPQAIQYLESGDVQGKVVISVKD